jgi:hypothetical protein
MIVFMGGKRSRKRPLGGLMTAGLQRAKRFREDGGLVLVARAGFFIPNGNSDRRHRHRDATLLALREAEAGAAKLMLIKPGHW